MHASNSGGHSTHADQVPDTERGKDVIVKVRRLDEFVQEKRLGRLDALKIDVQGAEWEVLAGGAQALERFKPFVLVEIENDSLMQTPAAGSPLEEAWRALEKSGYRIRLVGTKNDYSLIEASTIAQEELAKGHLQSNYVLIASVAACP